MLITLALAFFCIVLLVFGQTLLKVGLNDIGNFDLFGVDILLSLANLLKTPYIILGFCFYGVSAIFWLQVLSKMEFSMAFPLVSLTYIFALIIGRFVFHEVVTMSRILGVLLICSGLFFVVRSG
jgi:drug/metabolite transporter (DMT)-like permease